MVKSIASATSNSLQSLKSGRPGVKRDRSAYHRSFDASRAAERHLKYLKAKSEKAEAWRNEEIREASAEMKNVVASYCKRLISANHNCKRIRETEKEMVFAI